MMFYGKAREMVLRHFATFLQSMTLRKSLNIVLAAIELLLKRTRVQSRPFVIRVDPSTACNLRCPSCEAHTQPTNEKRLLELDTFQKILTKVQRNAVRMAFYDTGEPLVNRHIFNMVSKARNSGISTYINTNLTLFRPDTHLAELFNSGLNTLAVSIDGIDQESYATYRKRGRLDVVLAALQSILDKKNVTGKGPKVEVHVLDLDHLRPQKNRILSFFDRLGVDSVIWKEEGWGFNAETKALETKNSQRCYWLYSAAMIRPDGKLYPCCGRGFGRLSYGDLTEQSLDEIWNNEYYQFSRKLFQSGPDLPFDARMQKIPCLDCRAFTIKRGMRAPEQPIDNKRIAVQSLS